MGNMVALTQLKLQSNKFTGSIPAELTRLSNLQYLLLQDNQFTAVGERRDILSNRQTFTYSALSDMLVPFFY